MSNNKQKVFHLEIEGEHYYFGSPKAIFDTIGEERLRMKYASFHSNITLKVGDVYVNRRNGWIIRVGELVQAKTNRGNRWRDIIEGGIASALAARGLTEATEQPVMEQPAPEAEQTNEEKPVVEQPQIEQPIEQSVVEPAEQKAPEAKPEVQHTEEPAPRPAQRKKKSNDIPEQLTLF